MEDTMRRMEHLFILELLLFFLNIILNKSPSETKMESKIINKFF